MKMRCAVLLLAATGVVSAANSTFNFSFNQQSRTWDLSNGVVHGAFQMTADGRFQLSEMDHLASGVKWQAAAGQPSSPVRVRVGGVTYDGTTQYKLISQRTQQIDSKTERQVIVLHDLKGQVRIQVELEMSAGQPVIRHHISVSNLSFRTVRAEIADMLPYSFAPDAQTFRVWRVAQWTVAPKPQDFQSSEVTLDPGGAAASIQTGASGSYCTWMAVRDENNRGLLAGWEFDGLATAAAHFYQSDGYLQFASTVQSLNHPIRPGATFDVPGGFLGVFQGDWDEAGYRTQRYVEEALATPAPPDFPYVSWDSWGYQTAIDEATLRDNARIAANLGIELFIVDLGWARQIGDWTEDPQKFPSGLKALSDYVHSLGMKFGLHFALAEAMATAPVLQANPDWTSSESYDYYGALSLCLSNQATQQWVIGQALAMIDNYGVDWILQDGQTMVKKCTKSTHTHDPEDSNYSNAVDGIDAVVSAIRAARPNVLWENCENGGNMMTFSMVQRYVTSITNDASGALGARQGAYGATYPFSPRFADRYMPEDPSNTYATRSYMFGGPWHLMNQLPAMTPEASTVAASEIAVYKKIRGPIRTGMVYHATAAPAAGRTDALHSYDPATDTGVAIVTRENTGSSFANVVLEGFDPAKTYHVHFETDRRNLTMTGAQLASTGVRVSLPEAQSAEIVYVEPLK
jgi:alpha-galactosidase